MIGEPQLVILEEPQQHGQRFRYKCEGRSAGSIQGAKSSSGHKSVPAVKIQNYNGPGAIVVVSCVCKDPPYSPHPHSLVGNDCKDGVCTIRLRSGQTTAQLTNVGVQCCRRQDVAKNLELRQKLRVDPFGTGYPQSDIDLGVVRLCYQAFLPDNNKRFTRILRPLVSAQIFDKKTIRELVICRLSATSGSVQGGEEVFLLCEKVNKDDIQVRFFEEGEDGTAWEDYGEFTPQDVHRQVAIVFKTPPYRDLNITSPVTTFIQLRRQSDDEVGDPKPFIYRPKDRDPDGIELKKRKLNERVSLNLLNDVLPLSVLEHLKDEPDVRLYNSATRLQCKPVRKFTRLGNAATGSAVILPTTDLPQSSLGNVGADNIENFFLSSSGPVAATADVCSLAADKGPVHSSAFPSVELTVSSFDAVLNALGMPGTSDSKDMEVMSHEELVQFLANDNPMFTTSEVVEFNNKPS